MAIKNLEHRFEVKIKLLKLYSWQNLFWSNKYLVETKIIKIKL